MQRNGEDVSVREWGRGVGRVASLWSIAPPGTKPVAAAAPVRDYRRERDRAYRRRVRAIARGEAPEPFALAPQKRVRLPVGAPDRGGWLTRAAWGDADPELFFPVSPEADISAAMAICAGCPVRAECRQRADANGETWGVWAGADRSVRLGESQVA